MELTSAQQLAVNSVEDNVLVAAGAGSGKTMVLVERVIENLRRFPELKVSSLLAVTFTRKAAEEMRIRLKARIKQLASQSCGNDALRWKTALAEIDSAHIGTIHSLCQSILKTFPVECGVDPQFETFEEDDFEREEILELSVQQSLRELLIEQEAENSPLINYPLEQIRNWLFQVLNEPLQFDEALATFDLEDREKFQEAVRFLLKRVQERVIVDLTSNPEWSFLTQRLRENALPGDGNKMELLRQEMVERIDRVSEAISKDSEVPIGHTWAEIVALADFDLRCGRKNEETNNLKQILKPLRQLIKDHLPDLPEGVDTDDKDWELLVAVLSLISRTRAIYAEKKKEAQKLDFNDLIWLAYQALTRPDSKVQQFYRSHLKEILVDEFQDTNRLQARLLACLAGPSTRLFLIGDDKQSIYKFQGADVSTFNEWHDHFVGEERFSIANGIDIAGKRRLLTLHESFRSQARIVHFINELFTDLLGAGHSKAKYRAGYRALSATRNDEEAHSGERIEVVSFAVPDHGDRFQEQLLDQIEPRLVADSILKKMSDRIQVSNKDGSHRPASYGDFAILVQRNGDFAALERGLAERAIPYVTLGGKTFLRRQEVFDIENLLEFLADPMNDHALLGVLRSPIFSLPDDAIHKLVLGKRGSLWGALQRKAREKQDGLQPLNRACHLLKLFLGQVPLKSLRELLLSIITTTSYDLVLLTMTDGRQRSRNLWKLLDLASKNEHLSCGEFARLLKTMESFGVKQANAPLETSDAVKLMTIHKAKGLEFPIVLLPVLRAKSKASSAKLLFHYHYGVAINTARGREDTKPLFYTLASLVDEDMELAEKRRLLYVAATRARDYLTVFLPDETRRERSFASWLKTFLRTRIEDMDELESGEHVRCLGSNGGSLIIRRCAPKPPTSYQFSIEENTGKAPNHSEDSSSSDPEIKLDLIDAIEPQWRKPPSSGNGWLRVTSRTADATLDPVRIGNFFHSLMEFLPPDQSQLPDELMTAIAAASDERLVQGQDLARLVNEGRRLLSTYKQSELYEMIRSAQYVSRELPYHKLSNDELEIGRPDLLLKSKRGKWLIVDYKTDTFMPEDLEQHARQHLRQLRTYQDDLLSIANISAEIAIYFAQTGILYKFPTGPSTVVKEPFGQLSIFQIETQ